MQNAHKVVQAYFKANELPTLEQLNEHRHNILRRLLEDETRKTEALKHQQLLLPARCAEQLGSSCVIWASFCLRSFVFTEVNDFKTVGPDQFVGYVSLTENQEYVEVRTSINNWRGFQEGSGEARNLANDIDQKIAAIGNKWIKEELHRQWFLLPKSPRSNPPATLIDSPTTVDKKSSPVDGRDLLKKTCPAFLNPFYISGPWQMVFWGMLIVMLVVTSMNETFPSLADSIHETSDSLAYVLWDWGLIVGGGLLLAVAVANIWALIRGCNKP
jgi:hypothetical protein